MQLVRLGFAVAIGIVVAAAAKAVPDPVTPDAPLWVLSRTTATMTVDGQLDEPAWQSAVPIVRTQAWRDDGQIVIRMLYSTSGAQQGVFLSAQVRDENVWADGSGGGSGNSWEVEFDDSILFYFDPDRSRDEYMQGSDRCFGVNLGNMGDPVNGAARVRRMTFSQGDGAGGRPGIVIVPAGTAWASTIQGTLNGGSADTGWTIELFLPWATLNMAPPAHGDTIGMNFDLIFDNDGGTRNFVSHIADPLPDRIVLPVFVDDHVQGSHSSYSDSQAGVHGPVSYAEALFFDASVVTKPATIVDLSAENPSAFGAKLRFTAPAGTTSGSGHAAGYAIRYANAPIVSELDWNAATEFANGYVPRLHATPALTELLRVAGLEPETTYYFAVRAIDHGGRLGDLSNPASITTLPMSGSGDRGRVIPSPIGSMLVHEDGSPFVVVGEHLGLSWGYWRGLFPGPIWDPVGMQLLNFSVTTPYEGPPGPHFDALAAQGVNVLRIFIEYLGAFSQVSAPAMPTGRYWVEYPRGVFNPDIRTFLHEVLAEAAARDMYLILSPFDTFAYPAIFQQETPFYSGNCGVNGCGPLASLATFYQSADTLVMAKARFDQLIDWVQESPYADHVLGWEPFNEWDSGYWAQAYSEPGRETEMRARGAWLGELNRYVREQDPDRMVFSSSARRDPRGPGARALFYDRSFDVLAPHFYTNSSEEPINNPDPDTKVRPAIENAMLTAYWLTHRIDRRPLLNGEWGMTNGKWPLGYAFYQAAFTQAEDEAMYRTVLWSGLAAGQAGTGLRIVGTELEGPVALNSLTDSMRQVQATVAAFTSGNGFDWARFDARTLAGSVSATSPSKALLAWGSTDGSQGIAYVLQDGNASSGTVTDADLQIPGVEPGTDYVVRFWDPDGGASGQVAVASNVAVGSNGILSVTLPSFAEDLAVQFAPEPGASAQVAAALAALLVLARAHRFRIGTKTAAG